MFSSSKILPLEAPPTDGNLGPLPPSQLTEQEAEERELQNSSSNQAAPVESVATHTRTIGIIHPPPDIRSIVEKTAQFVSKNGLEFEKRIVASNAKNAKFNFLTSSDPYHAFYQHKLAEYRAQNQDGAQGNDDDTDGQNLQLDATGGGGGDGEAGEGQADLQAQFRVPPKPLEPPEPEKYTVRLPEGITGEELEYIKLTAQFVARNGKSFLTGLQSRESNNPQFHFMKPTHSLFSFFTALVDAYFDVLKPPEDLKEKLRKSAADLTTVLERCLHRLEWDRSQEQQRKKEEDEKEQERVQMAMIDWHDFVVVESIDFADEEDDELPPPMTLEDVIRRSKVSAAMEEDEVVEPGKEVEMEMDEEEVRLVAEGMRAANLEANGGSVKIESLNDEEAPMRIVKNWKRPEDRIPTERDPTKVVISPITGELIPISEMSEHMRISLIDPKFKEQKDRMFAKIRETTLAQDDEIAKNIVGLARLRPDIFGTTEEEVSNAVKAEIEKKKDEQPTQVIWDGHTGSIGRTANQALAQNANGEEQYGDPNSFPGPAALPPPRPGVPIVRPLPPPPNLALNLPRPPPSVQYPGPPRPLGVPMMQPMHPQHQLSMPGPPGHQQMMMNRPPPMQHGMPVPPPPGSQFAHHQVPRPYGQLPPPMHGMMQPPPMHGMPPPPPHEEAPPPLPEEPEPKRQKFDESALVPEEQFLAQHPGAATIRVSVPNVDDGQVIEITVQSLSENVGSLKEKIAGETQIPANKQKLSGKAGFLKDNMSLAHYNVGAGEILTLSLRERGGRKR
ncbi:putative splicing factor 3A subunit 1 [Raphanus sativus]|uniref:Probable splicing factor 3A subunit 1 n=1 Tax=Raphanus sativus TaxID=3726 RepID=A0A6J0JII9_RAPSA|nr:probable splicing factor 3A subunit 1 [Raphanus sativus]KAJ4915788.1 putative splicing factor 3A subunit 1 [Raphanus sativus]